MARNAVKNGQYCCLSVICKNWRAFDIQFHRLVLSIFFKTSVKDHLDSSNRLLERGVWLVCIEALLSHIHAQSSKCWSTYPILCFRSRFTAKRLVIPLFLICQQLLSQNAAGHRRRKRQSEGWSALRTFCDSVCKLLSTVISDYSCQDPGARGQDPLKAGEKQT